MELDELWGRTTGRLGYTWPTTAYAIGGWGRQRWHYDTLSSPHLPPLALDLGDDCGPQGAVEHGHRRRIRRGRRTFRRTTGQMEQRAD